VKIEAFPSHHLDAMRGLPNISFILLDEADFFPPGQQQDARDVTERYIAKSNPYIVMVSTPDAPDGLFERIEKEAEDTCIYKRIFLDYTYGIGGRRWHVPSSENRSRLFISKAIVEAHGGRIWAQNNNSNDINDDSNNNKKGATFTFTLPLSN
jgi:hypothetical protein